MYRRDDTSMGSLVSNLDAQEKDIASVIKALQEKKKMLESVRERVMENTLGFMKANPDLDFRGNIGGFSVCKNSSSGIQYNVKLQEQKHVIDPFDLDKFPSEYISKTVLFVLEKEKLERDLHAGVVTCNGAQVLPRGEHIRKVK
jgi:hypothetical protein